MYAISYKNKVVLSNKRWNKTFIERSFLIRFRVKLTDIPPSQPELPYTVNEDIVIYQAEENKPSFNEMIEYLEGPRWTIEDNVAYANYEKKDLPIENARQHFRNLAASERFKKETSGFYYNLNGNDVKIYTERDERHAYIQQLLLMGETQTVNWKFDTGWQVITRNDLQSIVFAGIQHIQDAFDWEKNICALIDAAQTKEELLEIEIIEKKESKNDDQSQ